MEHGKTSTIAYVKKYFESKGYEVYVINEVPTMLLNNGFNSKRCGEMEFLELIAKIEIFLSNTVEEYIKNDNAIVFYDKCPIDNLAFIEKDELEKMLEKLGTSFDKTINLFDLIIHLETIAKTYPELYSNDGNLNRTLDKRLAISRNDKLLEAYSNSKNRVIIEGTKDIQDKQNKVIEAIEKILK